MIKSPPIISKVLRISFRKRVETRITIGVYSMPAMVIVLVSVSDRAFMKNVSEITIPKKELMNSNGIEISETEEIASRWNGIRHANNKITNRWRQKFLAVTESPQPPFFINTTPSAQKNAERSAAASPKLMFMGR